jgi:hypothetical protein
MITMPQRLDTLITSLEALERNIQYHRILMFILVYADMLNSRIGWYQNFFQIANFCTEQNDNGCRDKYFRNHLALLAKCVMKLASFCAPSKEMEL